MYPLSFPRHRLARRTPEPNSDFASRDESGTMAAMGSKGMKRREPHHRLAKVLDHWTCGNWPIGPVRNISPTAADSTLAQSASATGRRRAVGATCQNRKGDQ